MPPPYALNNVTTRVFVVDADMAGLKAYCDKFLNGDGNSNWNSPYHYRPLAPFGYLCVAHYPYMEALRPEFQHSGFSHQNEVYFSFPVVQYEKVRYRLRPLKLTFAVPFITVDQPSSAFCGQEVLGLEKLVGTFAFSGRDGSPARPTDWTNLKVSLYGVSHLTPDSPGHQIKAIEFTLGDERKDPDFDLDRFPFADWRKELSRHAPDGEDTLRLLNSISELPRPGLFSTVTLKQFRDPVHVDRALYQALVGYDTKFENPRLDRNESKVDDTGLRTSVSVYKENANLRLALAWAQGIKSREDGAKVVQVNPRLSYPFQADLTIHRFSTVYSETPTATPTSPRPPYSDQPYSIGFSWHFGLLAGEGRIGLRGGNAGSQPSQTMRQAGGLESSAGSGLPLVNAFRKTRETVSPRLGFAFQRDAPTLDRTTRRKVSGSEVPRRSHRRDLQGVALLEPFASLRCEAGRALRLGDFQSATGLGRRAVRA